MFDYASFIMYVKQVPQVQYGWEYSTHVDSFYHRHDIITWNNQEKYGTYPILMLEQCTVGKTVFG